MKQWMIRLACSLTLMLAIAVLLQTPRRQRLSRQEFNRRVTENIQTKPRTRLRYSGWTNILGRTLGHRCLHMAILGAFLVISIGLIVKRVLVNYIEKKIEAVQKTEATWDDLLFDALLSRSTLIMVAAVHVAVLVLVVNLAKFPLSIIGKTFTVCLGFTIILLVYRLVNVLAGYLDDLLADKDQGLRGQFMPFIRKALRSLG